VPACVACDKPSPFVNSAPDTVRFGTMVAKHHRAHVSLCQPAWPGSSVLQLIRIRLPKLQTPLADGFMGDVDTALEQNLLHIAIAQGEAIVEPDPMADDLPRETVVLVAFGVSGWRHIWLPMGVCEWFVRGSTGVSISRVRKPGQ